MNLVKFIQLDENQNYQSPYKLLMKTENYCLIFYYAVFLLLIISYSVIYSTYLSYPMIRKGLKETLYCMNTNEVELKKKRNNRLYRIMTLIRSLKDLEVSSPITPYTSPVKQLYIENNKNNTRKVNSNEINMHNHNNNNQKEVSTNHVEENKDDELCDTLISANQISLN